MVKGKMTEVAVKVSQDVLLFILIISWLQEQREKVEMYYIQVHISSD